MTTISTTDQFGCFDFDTAPDVKPESDLETFQNSCQAIPYEAARPPDVPISTSLNRWGGKKPRGKVIGTMLTAEEEKMLAAWIRDNAKMRCKLSELQVRREAQNILNARGAITKSCDNMPGATWPVRFRRRHPGVTFRCIGEPCKVCQPAISFSSYITPAETNSNVMTVPYTGTVSCPPETEETLKEEEPPEASSSLPPPARSSTCPSLPRQAPPQPSCSSTVVADSSHCVDGSEECPTLCSVSRTIPSHVDFRKKTKATSPSPSLSYIDTISAEVALDRILDLTAKAGLEGLVRYRSLYTLGIPPEDHEERLFSCLYSKLITPYGPQKTKKRLCKKNAPDSGGTSRKPATSGKAKKRKAESNKDKTNKRQKVNKN